MNNPEVQRTVLFVVTEDWYFVSHRLPLARQAIGQGYRVVVATRAQNHAAEITAAGCELLDLPLRRGGRNPFRELLSIWRMSRLYRAVRPDIIHHVALKPVLYGSLAAIGARIPVVVNAIAGLGFFFTSEKLTARLGRPVIRFALRRLLRRPNTWVVVQNPDDERVLLSEGMAKASRVLLVPGVGVDLSAFRPTANLHEAGPIRVVMASRMLWDKGVGEFVEAARRLREADAPIQMVLAGDSDDDNPSSVSRAQLARWRDEGVVEWLGRVKDMARVWREADVCCLPSAYGEGVPKVLLEAAAAGLPIVTTDIPGCRLVVEHGVNGMLIAPRDVQGLVAALLTMSTDRALRLRMGEASRKRAEARFDERSATASVLQLYARALAEVPRTLLVLVTEDSFVLSHWRPLIRFGTARGYRVVVATRVATGRASVLALGAEVCHIEWRRGGRNPFAELHTLVSIVKLYRRVRPDVVHHVAIKPVLYGSLAARFAGTPRKVNALSGLGYVFSGRGIAPALLRVLTTIALRTVADGPRTAMLFENRDDELLFRQYRIVRRSVTVQVPGAGVDLGAYDPGAIPEEPPVVLLPSRMLWDKGIGEFVQAARILASEGVHARFVLAGGRDPANPASIPLAVLEEWNRSGVVKWIGHRDDVPALMGTASLVVLPSYREGLPRVLAEACAAGRAIVTTDVPGCRDVVRDGRTGLLVPARDAPALAEAMRVLLASPEEREAMGRAGRERAVAEFGEANVMACFAEAYARIGG